MVLVKKYIVGFINTSMRTFERICNPCECTALMWHGLEIRASQLKKHASQKHLFVFLLALICLFGNVMYAQNQPAERNSQNTQYEQSKTPASSRAKRKKAKKEWKEQRKKEKAERKKIKDHHKRIQNKETRKRMKQNKRKAKRVNENKREFFLIRWFKKK